MRSCLLSTLCTAVVLVLASGLAEAQTPLGAAFTYQGQLKDGGNPAIGLYDMHFRLYDAATDGTQLGPIICYNNLSVTNGLFTATLDFGDQFTGQERFLEIAIRIDAGQNCANTSGFTTLSPRQRLTGAPNALFSLNADKLDGLDSTAFLQSIPVPLTISGANSTHIIKGENTSTTSGISGIHGVSSGATGDSYGGRFECASNSGRGVYGRASAASGWTYGVYGKSDSTSGRGVYGHAIATTGDARGVFGLSNSTSGLGTVGYALAATGMTYGVYGQSDSTSGRGVYGLATATSGTSYGVYGQSDSSAGYAGYFVGKGSDALYVTNDSNGRGLQVVAANDTALWASTTAGIAAVDGRNASSTGRGVYGYATATSGGNSGVYGRTSSTDGRGVYGTATASSGYTYGGRFESQSTGGTGVRGDANASSGTTCGVQGHSDSPSGRGVYGAATATSGTTYGVYGESYSSSGRGVYGAAGGGYTSGSPVGVYGYCSTLVEDGYAVYANGDFGAYGTKSFRIDHPHDPENKYLLHYSIESPEVLNAYSGKVTLDASGQAEVELPVYFASINKDPRYMLTAVGAPMPNLHVAEEISEKNLKAGEQAGPGTAPSICTFRIAGGVAGGKVCWRVEAVRNDVVVRTRGAPVEREKTVPERGRYQHPELYGQPGEKGMDHHEVQPKNPR